jgi:hypothetical protein
MRTKTGKFYMRWEGPYVVVDKISNLNYLVRRNEENFTTVVHVNRMKKYKKGEIETVVIEDDEITREEETQDRNDPQSLPVVPPQTDQEIEVAEEMLVTDAPPENRTQGNQAGESTDGKLVDEEETTTEKKKRGRPLKKRGRPTKQTPNPPAKLSSKIAKKKERNQIAEPTLKMKLRQTIKPRNVLNL